MIKKYITQNSEKEGIYINIKQLVKDFNKSARKAAKQVGGFSHLFDQIKYEANINKTCYNCRGELNDMCALYLAQILRDNTNITYDNLPLDWKQCTYLINLMIKYSINLCYGKTLKGNSANALMTIINTIDITKNITNNSHIPMIIKVQIDRRADDILIDAVNGQILEWIIQQQPQQQQQILRPNIMEYISSFRCYIQKNNNNKKYELDLTIKYIEILRQKLNNTDLNKSYKSYKCFVAKAIKHKTMHTMIKDKLLRGKLHKLIPFVNNLLYLGEKYGFVHNDCHLGNILFDEDQNTFVLIDFGRVYFYISPNTFGLPTDICNEILKNEKKKLDENYGNNSSVYGTDLFSHQMECIKNEEKNRNSVYINPYISNKIQDNKSYFYYIKNMILFDISTMVMNILQNLSENNKLVTLLSILNLTECISIINNNNNTKIIINNTIIIQKKIENKENKENKEDKENKKDKVDKENKKDKVKSIFLLGIYIFTIFIEFLIKEFGVNSRFKYSQEENIEIEFTQFVEKDKLMWHCYQYLSIPKINKFANFMYSHHTNIEKLKSNITNITNDKKANTGGTITTTTETTTEHLVIRKTGEMKPQLYTDMINVQEKNQNLKPPKDIKINCQYTDVTSDATPYVTQNRNIIPLKNPIELMNNEIDEIDEIYKDDDAKKF